MLGVVVDPVTQRSKCGYGIPYAPPYQSSRRRFSLSLLQDESTDGRHGLQLRWSRECRWGKFFCLWTFVDYLTGSCS